MRRGVQRLGRRINRTKHQISRLESGDTKLDVQTADAVAQALGTTIDEVLGLPSTKNGASPAGFSDLAEPYIPSADDPLASQIGGNRYAYTIDSDSLELIGIVRGDRVVVNDSAAAVAAVKPLQAVLVNWRSKTQPDHPMILPRQFVPPSLAITNGRNNAPTLVLDGDTHIFAVIESVHRRLT